MCISLMNKLLVFAVGDSTEKGKQHLILVANMNQRKLGNNAPWSMLQVLFIKSKYEFSVCVGVCVCMCVLQSQVENIWKTFCIQMYLLNVLKCTYDPHID